MIDHRMEALPSLGGSFVRSLLSSAPLPAVVVVVVQFQHVLLVRLVSAARQQRQGAPRAHIPVFPVLRRRRRQPLGRRCDVASVRSSPRLGRLAVLPLVQQSVVLPFLSSPSPKPASSPGPQASSSSLHSGLLLSYPATHTATGSPSGSLSSFGLPLSFAPTGLSRLYSGASLSGSSSDTDCGLAEAPFMQPFSSGDFSLMRFPSASCDVPLNLSLHSAVAGPLPLTTTSSSPLSLVSLSVSRSTSSTSVSSSSLSLLSPRPRSLVSSGRERGDATLLAAAAHSDSSSSSNTLWHCSYGCGKVYRKSSGRSIRRHVVSCFKVHWPGGADLSDSELSTLIALQQDRGLLVTGLRRWKMRQSRRPAHELTESEKWRCPWNCGKFYRSTSSRSIQRHATTCPNRAAEHSLSPAIDNKRVKRQRDDSEQQVPDVDDDERGNGLELSSGSDGDDDDEAEETTDSSSSARSGNVRMRSTGLRNSQLALSSSPLSSTSSFQQRVLGQPSGTAASVPSLDVDFLYPDSSSSSTPSSLTSQSSTSATGAASSTPAYDVLTVQKREVAMQLQRLLRDIHRRHGTNHPVFQSPMMTQQLIDGLLNKDVDDAVDDMTSEQPQRPTPSLAVRPPADGGSSSSSSSSSRSSSSRRGKAGRSHRRGSRAVMADSGSLLSPSSSSVSSSAAFPPSAPSTPSSSSAALQWTCQCGSSFKITSSKSIQKHRASCDTHQTQTGASTAPGRLPAKHEPRIKREKH